MLNVDNINKYNINSSYVQSGAKEIVKMLNGIEFCKAKKILELALHEELEKVKVCYNDD